MFLIQIIFALHLLGCYSVSAHPILSVNPLVKRAFPAASGVHLEQTISTGVSHAEAGLSSTHAFEFDTMGSNMGKADESLNVLKDGQELLPDSKKEGNLSGLNEEINKSPLITKEPNVEKAPAQTINHVDDELSASRINNSIDRLATVMSTDRNGVVRVATNPNNLNKFLFRRMK
ncbi:hypothetical protein PGT21_019472 [Puccinia graminis f. sp. tritici]|uniref:Uncharacterized protein n=1 Tax=Puccinia graminis f. sp. tritici TaxID=56615 RepID=A0A5B0S2Z6_PUCGR|nr:hypothetical protein PGT21_019472 [Puccinia graminis f. sp. tritici]KAA1131899.1 hypothetical protein PGTUg99_033196 [Puccinia graminis f. sp. tritici]